MEHADHTVGYILAGPELMKEIVRDIDAAQFTVGTEYIGELWTAKLYVTDKILSNHVMFSNADLSVVLDLYINNME